MSLALIGLLAMAVVRDAAAFYEGAVSDVSFQVEKRASYPVDPLTVRVVTSELGEIVASKWNEAKPLIERLEIDMAICESRIISQQQICEECTTRECTPEEMDIVDFISEGSVKLVKNLAKGIEDFGKDVGDELENFGENVIDKIKDFGGGLEDIGKDIGKGIKNIGENAIDTVKDVGKGIGDGIKDVVDNVQDTVEDIGKGIGKVADKVHDTIKDVGKSVGKAVSKVFRAPRISVPRIRFRRWGKKKRAVNDVTDFYDSVSDIYLRDTVEECMARCSACEPFLEQPKLIVGAICGDELLKLNKTVSLTTHKFKVLKNHVTKENSQFITSVEYDPNTFDPNQGGFTGVFVNAYFERGFRTYQSKVPYRLSAISDTAALLAAEYWELFMNPWLTFVCISFSCFL